MRWQDETFSEEVDFRQIKFQLYYDYETFADFS